MRVRKIFAPCAMALAALAIPATSAHAQSPATHDRDVMSAAVHRGQYNKDSAPDATSRAILQVPIERLYGATRPIGDVTAAMHAAFPQIIEQNFARLDKTQMEALVNGLTEAELSDLAQLYVNATSDTGAPQRLLKVMAHRLSSKHLGRISRHFGFASVYEAVNSEKHPRSATTSSMRAIRVIKRQQSVN